MPRKATELPGRYCSPHMSSLLIKVRTVSWPTILPKEVNAESRTTLLGGCIRAFHVFSGPGLRQIRMVAVLTYFQGGASISVSGGAHGTRVPDYSGRPIMDSDSRSSRGGCDAGSISTSLLGRVKAGEGEAWRRLVELYAPLLYEWCRRRGLQAEDAADVAQEVFAAVARNIESFRRDRPGDSFRGWLWTITRSKIRDHFRRFKGQPEAQGGTDAQLRLAEIPEPPSDASQSCVARRLRQQSWSGGPSSWSARASRSGPGRRFGAVAVEGKEVSRGCQVAWNQRPGGVRRQVPDSAEGPPRTRRADRMTLPP